MIETDILIVGAGPAGLAAAYFLGRAGAAVTLYEKADKLGGMLHTTSALPFKGDMRRYLAWMIEKTATCGATIHLNTAATPELIEKEAPDVVLVAGDVFTSSYQGLRHPEKYSAALRKIRAPQGVFAVCGNHDVEEELFGGFAITPRSEAIRNRDMEAFFRHSGFTVLEDDRVDLPGGTVLVGRIDGEKPGDGTTDRASGADLLKDVAKNVPVLVLEHEPMGYEELAAAGADVVLSGHTHAGQIFPGNLLIPFFNENAWGHRKLHGIDTFVTAGVGYYGPPMRIGTSSEITVINMHFQEGRKQ